MSRGLEGEDRREERGPTGPRAEEAPGFPRSIAKLLRPWIDLDEVGWRGFEAWLHSVLPLVPPPGPPRRGPPATEPRQRVAELARALSACASDRARVHFEAAGYFRENQALTRRVKALESMVRTRSGTEEGPDLPPDPDADRAAERYLPHGRSAP